MDAALHYTILVYCTPHLKDCIYLIWCHKEFSPLNHRTLQILRGLFYDDLNWSCLGLFICKRHFLWFKNKKTINFIYYLIHTFIQSLKSPLLEIKLNSNNRFMWLNSMSIYLNMCKHVIGIENLTIIIQTIFLSFLSMPST